MKLYSKTYLLILPLAIIPLLLLGWISYTQITTNNKKIILDEMNSSFKQIQSNYKLHIQTAKSNINLFSSHNTVSQYAVTDDPETRLSLMQIPLMDQFHKNNESFPGYYEFRFILPDGYEDTRWTNTRIKNITENENNNILFKNMDSFEDNIFYSIFKNDDISQPALWISKRIKIRDRTFDPITKKPKLRGYLVITSNLNFISKSISNLRIGKNGFFIIINDEGKLIVSPDSISDKNFNNKTYSKLDFGSENWEKIKKPSFQSKYIIKNNVKYIVNSEILDEKLFLVAILPDKEFQSGSQTIKTAVSIITLTSILLSTLLIMFVIKHLLISPINILNKATKEISLGQLDTNIDIKSNDEIGELANSFNEMTLNLKESNEQVKYLAYHDSLTGLPNRLMFKEYLEPILARAKRNDEIFAILFLDLDDFKRVNDSLGHKAGDILLQNIALKLTRCVRDEDFISHRDSNTDFASNIVARLGGDEFIILLSDIGRPYEASIVAERILLEFKKSETIENHELHVSSSIGISVYPNDGDTPDVLIKNADLAMYHAKESGKNIYRNFSESLNKSAKIRLSMENKLHKAIENGDFILHYQPQINLNTNKIYGIEALIRWNDPEQGMIPPNDFIYLAEENGLILEITEWVLYESCRQNKEWQDAGLPPITVSSNISGIDVSRRDLYSLVQKTLTTTKLNPEYLEIELTESVMMSSGTDVVGVLNKIHETGVSIALDDFGTGYSALNYLLRFPIQTLKIDRSFIIDIEHNNTKSSLTSSIINMAHTLDLKVIAEGIEKEEQLNILKNHKCDIIQGYYFSKPVESHVIEAMLTREKYAK